MSCSGNKLSVFILIFLSAFIANTQGSCWRYGHSCWGGHGKRSGGGGSSGGSGHGARKVDSSWGERNPGSSSLEGMNANPVLQFDDVPSIASSGSEYNSEGAEEQEPMFSAALGSFEANLLDLPARKLSMKPISTRAGNGKLNDKSPANERDDYNGGYEELPTVEIYDYGQQNDDSLVQPQLPLGQSGKQRNRGTVLLGFNRNGGIDVKSHSMDSMEDMKRAAEVSTRKHPLNNLFTYKLIRLQRRK